MPDRIVRVPEGIPIQFFEIPALIASALHDDEVVRMLSCDELESELTQKVQSGELQVLDSLTRAPLTFPMGKPLRDAIVMPETLHSVLSAKGITLILEKAWEVYTRTFGADIFPTGTYMHSQAAFEIAQAQGWSGEQENALDDEMAIAINDRSLPTYDRNMGLRLPGNAKPEFLLLVTLSDVNDWLEKRGAHYRWIRPTASLSIDELKVLASAECWNEKTLACLCLGVSPRFGDREDVAPADERKRVSTEIAKDIASSRLRAELEPGGNALYGQWRIARIDAVKWVFSKSPMFSKFPEYLFTRTLPQIYSEQETDKRNAGRYTLEEAANCIAEAGERPEPMQEKLLAAAGRGDLPTYGPGELARYQYSERVSARLYYEEAYWNDLNKWLEDNEQRISFRFLQPNSTSEKSSRSDAIPFNVLLTAESTTRALEFDTHLDPGIKSALIHGLTDEAKQAEAAGAAAISTMGRKGGSKDKRPLTKAYALRLAGEYVNGRKASQFAGTIANAIKARVYSYSRSNEVNENLSENSDTLKMWIKNSDLPQKRR